MTERLKALGKYGSLKDEFFKLGIKAGSLLETLRDKTNSILADDFLELDLKTASVLIDELVDVQSRAKAIYKKMEEIRNNYGIEDED